jgi:glycine cleavage system H protein
MMEETMSEIPEALRYTKAHEWVRAEGDRWRVGITRFATQELGDVVMVELPKVGDAIEQAAAVGTIESVKAVSELYAPVSGRVTAINEALSSEPELVNNDPYGGGWMIEVEPSNRGELDGLLTADAYGKLLAAAH